MENSEKEFIAFSRKLLRNLEAIKGALIAGDIDKVRTDLDELIEETKGDIED